VKSDRLLAGNHNLCSDNLSATTLHLSFQC